jgi:hypothetical protein
MATRLVHGRLSHKGRDMEALEQERCSHCGWVFDEDGECDCRPEGYILPGSTTLMYVNAYSITRHYGGPQEGGWWYNHGEPIASIPVRAVSKPGHENCYRCSQAARGEKDSEGNLITMCKWGFHLEEENPEQVEAFKKHLTDIFAEVNEGNIYSVLGGSELSISLQDHPGEEFPQGRPHYE